MLLPGSCDRLTTRVFKPGGVGHDSQIVPGEILSPVYFHLIAERQTSTRPPSAKHIKIIATLAI